MVFVNKKRVSCVGYSIMRTTLIARSFRDIRAME